MRAGYVVTNHGNNGSKFRAENAVALRNSSCQSGLAPRSPNLDNCAPTLLVFPEYCFSRLQIWLPLGLSHSAWARPFYLPEEPCPLPLRSSFSTEDLAAGPVHLLAFPSSARVPGTHGLRIHVIHAKERPLDGPLGRRACHKKSKRLRFQLLQAPTLSNLFTIRLT